MGEAWLCRHVLGRISERAIDPSAQEIIKGVLTLDSTAYLSNIQLAHMARSMGFKDMRIPRKYLPPIQRVLIDALVEGRDAIGELGETLHGVVRKVLESPELELVRELIGFKGTKDKYLIASVALTCPHCGETVIPATSFSYKYSPSRDEYYTIETKTKGETIKVFVRKITERTSVREAPVGRIVCPHCGRSISKAQERIIHEYVPLIAVKPGMSKVEPEGYEWAWNLRNVDRLVNLSKDLAKKHTGNTTENVLLKYLDPVGVIVWSLILKEANKVLPENPSAKALLALTFLEHLGYTSRYSIVSPRGFIRNFFTALMKSPPIGRPWLSIVPGRDLRESILVKSIEGAINCLSKVMTFLDVYDVKVTDDIIEGTVFLSAGSTLSESINSKVREILTALIGQSIEAKDIIREGGKSARKIDGVVVVICGRIAEIDELSCNLRELYKRFNLKKKALVMPYEHPKTVLLALSSRKEKPLFIPQKRVEVLIGKGNKVALEGLKLLLNIVVEDREKAKRLLKKYIAANKVERAVEKLVVVLMESPSVINILEGMNKVLESPDVPYIILCPYTIKEFNTRIILSIWSREGKIRVIPLPVEMEEDLDEVIRYIKKKGEKKDGIVVLRGEDTFKPIVLVMRQIDGIALFVRDVYFWLREIFTEISKNAPDILSKIEDDEKK